MPGSVIGALKNSPLCLFNILKSIDLRLRKKSMQNFASSSDNPSGASTRGGRFYFIQ
jgi:hypothetical protein